MFNRLLQHYGVWKKNDLLRSIQVYYLHTFRINFIHVINIIINIIICQGRPNDRSRTISESIMLEFIFRPRTRKLIVAIMNKLSISFICILYYF
jgi:hypothetical protein